MATSLTLRRAQELERLAKASGRPTPRAAAEALLADDAAELRRLDEQRQQVWLRLAERLVRQNRELDDQGRGLPKRHPDRIGYRTLAKLIRKDGMQVQRWMFRYLDEFGQPPTYKPDDTDAPSAAAGP